MINLIIRPEKNHDSNKNKADKKDSKKVNMK